ncbi:hypothetical protein NEOLEDRAFT_491888 [Neolentinus lepideus HHB14362 ss-1]|uniref:Uncharacterized protein n=1 Tax=Neolentinus lepideus HHB14362 ss-1 TaxID=1314782 RepID=A0A165RLW9_9AGAM|nr:hypothetical protein NEOLEDRAFT_491888 [Neolentinus lepideus HHB14362 ss-1]
MFSVSWTLIFASRALGRTLDLECFEPDTHWMIPDTDKHRHRMASISARGPVPAVVHQRFWYSPCHDSTKHVSILCQLKKTKENPTCKALDLAGGHLTRLAGTLHPSRHIRFLGAYRRVRQIFPEQLSSWIWEEAKFYRKDTAGRSRSEWCANLAWD